MFEKYGLLVEGEWRPAADGGTLAVISPVSEMEIGRIPAAGRKDIDLALSVCASIAPAWARVPAWERAAILRKAAENLKDDAETYARIMSTETGKPLAEARAEVQASADQFEWYGEEAKRIYGQIIPGRNPDERLSVSYQPVGPCLALSAWNFPMLLPSRKIAAALAAGNPVIARPASEAPGSCFAIGEALMKAGLPAGVLSILTGSAVPMVGDLIASPVIRKVSLTGSVEVGRSILRQAAEGIKKVTMELGGHAPVIVYPDSDPVAAAHKLAATKFRNCGQVCISPTRFYIHRDIYASFAETFTEYAQGLKVGDGLEETVTTGPMIRARGLKTALSLVEDAIDCGAELLTGGRRPPEHNTGHFLQPTVLGNVPDKARIMSDEPFAPVAPLTAFDSFNEVIERANSTEFGLASYVFTRDSDLAARTSEALEAGMVGINETLLATAEAPFGGIKESGFGREGGSLGILDYLTPKYTRHKFLKGTLDV
ncbi:Succinate-semialdehyde dehydrogenase [NADP(+)] GabD (plasmid) [Labrenzia sp. THAF191b]|uniref:NAD-dependent succinate-semialdehyde dehydrogenase n=1 Tax=unclassified Labrenzia TaxID=2648686 RepID=UPI0012683183|nr:MULTISPECIES: NAD-dependent succinate-semialdehyde dehydrogenase [unclassified Labrenzia]QFT01663.1 Succinate-semialdehyde dehydrogenase [NADP(+)] GabD [Labrenzia sp. THAF191b]QFT07868.1 Succinate-semialdehyde dehydrogenase [NADP(+)] GabD [Labrenzia sp. THAF191a]QFT19266.1 Succinate-semialdehyde dehydrogenase [NADP(+)] GabD [Labrenzia sp. THAF187b]